MTRIVNYFPNPRMRGIGSLLRYNGCSLDDCTSEYDPSRSLYPGLTLKATKNGDNWAEMNIALPAGERLIVSCNSIGADTSNGAAMSIWTSNGVSFLAKNTLGSLNASGEFIVPSNGQVKVTFRASRTTNDKVSIVNVFIGRMEDWKNLLGIIPSGFMAWDLMPLSRD